MKIRLEGIRWLPLIAWLSILSMPFLNLYLFVRHPKIYRYYHLEAWCRETYLSGNLERAAALAQEYLALNDEIKRNWNYGNAVHDANQILGLVALRHGDIEEAIRRLALAGATPGSPQLDSYGPKMILARELLTAGHVKPVMDYLKAVGAFYCAEKDYFAGIDSFRDYQEGKKRTLKEWKRLAAQGIVPPDNNWRWRSEKLS